MSDVLKHYEHLHAIPELGFEEYKTSAYLAQKLKDAGYTVTENVNNTTGIIGVLDSGKPGPTLALRADMDALGHMIDGQLCARHTCGHDGHSSIVLTVAQEIMAQGLVKKGKLRIIFQPAEELGAGALKMIEGGAIDGVDMIMGIHVRPVEECLFGQASPAVFYSASSTIEAKIKGVPAHGARPHLGINALDAAICAANAVNTIRMNPGVSYSAKATKLICDSGVTNAIPADAVVYWDLRAQNNQTMDRLKEKVYTAIEHGVASVGATVETRLDKNLPAAELDAGMTELVAQCIKDVLGEDGLKPPIMTPGGEDFFFYTHHNPKLKAGFIGLGADLKPGLHHPDMHFDMRALENGVHIMKRCVEKILGD